MRLASGFPSAMLLPARLLLLTTFGFGLLGHPAPVVAQEAPVVSAAAVSLAPRVPAALPAAPVFASPKLLLKAGLRLTHLFYLPDYRSFQLVLPMSFGVEYRLNPHLSLFAQAEADMAAGQAPRGRRSGATPGSGASLGLGGRYYFNQARTRCNGAPPECWGNYLALETNTDLSATGRLRGSGRSRAGGRRSLTRLTPSVFVLLGAQHAIAGRRLLYDLNAGLGCEAPPPYTAEGAGSPSWNVAAQVNLRVYLVNHRQTCR